MIVGIAGCGRMGRPMAEAMITAGIDLRAFDVHPSDEFGSFATHLIDDPRTFAEPVTTLVSVVRDVAQTEDLLFGAQNVIAHAPALDTIILCSTLSPRYLRTLRARVPERIALIDAPMSGAAVAASEARLTFMLGGENDALDRHRPLFEAMGKTIHRLGSFGSGMTVKVLNNLAAASSTAITRLALDWADALGVSADALLEVMNDSSGQTWFSANFDQIEFARDGLEPDNTIAILVKDVQSAIDGAPEGADIALPEALVEAIGKLRPRP